MVYNTHGMKVNQIFRQYKSALDANPPVLKYFLVVAFLSEVGFTFYFTVFNLYLAGLGVSMGVIGTILSARSFGSVLMTVPAALVINRIGYRRTFVTAMLLAVVAQAVVLLTRSSVVLVGIGAILGLSDALFMIGTAPFLMDHTDARYRKEVFSFNGALFTLAFAAGSFLTYLSGYLRVGDPLRLYRTIMWSGVACAGVALILAALLIKTKSRASLSNPFTPENLKHLKGFYPLLAVLITPRVLVGLGASLIIPFMNLYFHDLFKLTGPQVGLVYTFGQLATAMGMLVAPLLAARLGYVKTIVFTELASLPFMYALAAAGSLTVALPAFLIRQALMNMSSPVSQQFNMELTPLQFRTITNGLMSMGDNLARAAGSLIAGFLIESRGYAASFYAAMLLYFISSVFYYVFLSPHESKVTA
ncbi:MFS transporter [Coprothermobacteraceae bacterium]|nr:MFS transporter [Coprothermobacteraceae bacterium]